MVCVCLRLKMSFRESMNPQNCMWNSGWRHTVLVWAFVVVTLFLQNPWLQTLPDYPKNRLLLSYSFPSWDPGALKNHEVWNKPDSLLWRFSEILCLHHFVVLGILWFCDYFSCKWGVYSPWGYKLILSHNYFGLLQLRYVIVSSDIHAVWSIVFWECQNREHTFLC